MLDGLRGICALAVMLVHFSHFNGMTWFKNAGAAVDAFFIISGFVMTQSYDHRIQNGYKLRRFMLSRFIRLAPLNLFASTLGLIVVVLIINSSKQFASLSAGTLAYSYLLSIFFIPNFNELSWPFGTEVQVGGIYPLNLPAWSLFLEWIAYLTFFCMIKYLRKYVTSCWILFVICYGVLSIVYQMDNPGWNQASLWQGISRVLFGFFTGVVIRQNLKEFSRVNIAVLSVISAIAFVLLFFGDARLSLLNTFLFVPLTIKLLAVVKLNAFYTKICSAFGQISFPLYMIHVPIATLVYSQIGYIRAFSPVVQIASLSILTIVVAFILNAGDLRLRNGINTRLARV